MTDIQKIPFAPAGGEHRTLGAKAVKGGIWLFAASVVHRGLGFARTIILARLLSPDDFGLMGIAVLAISSLDTFSKLGLEPALVQKKEDIRGYLDTTWTIQLVRAAILFAILYFGAPMIAGFFRSGKAVSVIRAIAFLELLMGAKNIGVVYFQKELRFGRSFALSASEIMVNVVVSVALAFLLRNVWALVYGSLAGAFTTFVLSYILHPYRPRLSLQMAKAKELFDFGKWLFGKSVLYFLLTQGDNAFVGRVLGVTYLGFYQMAYNLSYAPFMTVISILAVVMFPVYSIIQDDAQRLSKAFLETFQLNMFMLVPVAAGVALLGRDFTMIFLGAKWEPMITALIILVFSGLLNSVIALAGNVFYGIGRPKLDTLLEGVRLLVFAALICPLTMRWGITGTAVSVLAGSCAALVGFIYNLLPVIRVRLRQFIGCALYSILSAAFMVGVVLFLRTVLMGGMPGFLISFAVAIAAYILASYVCIRYAGYGIYDIIRNRIKAVL